MPTKPVYYWNGKEWVPFPQQTKLGDSILWVAPLDWVKGGVLPDGTVLGDLYFVRKEDDEPLP